MMMAKDNSFGFVQFCRMKTILSKDTLNENEVRLLLRRVNDGSLKVSRIPNITGDVEGYKLTDSQVKKGRQWLMNQWKTPTGKERQNNPFGGREEYILENLKTIKLIDLISPRGRVYYPVYRVISKDGNHFEYYVAGGIHIIG